IAHLYSPFLYSFPIHFAENKKFYVFAKRTNPATIDFKEIFPTVGMIISGGHTNLVYLKSFENYQLLGQTRDDAAGEAFDKVAKILNLDYPGGPIIEKLALKGDADKIKFNCAPLRGSFDFSFSGIKTAVLYKLQATSYKPQARGQKIKNKKPVACSLQPVACVSDIAAGFQKAVVDVLVEKAIGACLLNKCRNLILGGGVTANSCLKKRMFEAVSQNKINLFYPAFQFCTDNAAMIAGLACHLSNKKHFADLDLTPSANLGV
ncbi:MAG: hypothetical protein KAS87_00030, partial [Candidatus Omnitrophica bacterium]|nr:hypothetical protein [Candidatus Omnitrophota bacterium]